MVSHSSENAMSEIDIQIVSPADFDISKVSFTEPKKKDDKLRCLILYNGAPFFVETEWGRAPFGVSSFDGEKTDNYSLNLSLAPDCEFVKNLLALEDKFNDFVFENGGVIFKKKPANKDMLRMMFSAGVKAEGDYDPRIALKVQRKSSSDPSPNLLFYHSETEEVEIETMEQVIKLVPKGSKVKALVSMRPWFINNRFGLSYTVQQLLVPKRAGGKPTTYAFNDRTGAVATKISAEKAASSVKGDDEEDDVEEVVADKAEAEAESAENSDDVVDAEDVEDEDDEPPAPAKNVKKAPTAVAATASKQKPKPVTRK